jgi:prevent-host-death family protein
MSATLSVREAQAQLPELVARAARDAEPCNIEDNGEAVAVLVSLRSWQRRARRHGEGTSAAAEEHEHRLRAYQRQMEQLGPDYWPPPDQQARLKEPTSAPSGNLTTRRWATSVGLPRAAPGRNRPASEYARRSGRP